MRFRALASRNAKELMRDPLNLVFSTGLPLLLLVLMSVIERNVSVDIFRIELLAPGMAVFGLSFVMLFSGQLLGRDRSTSFLMRLFVSPLSSSDFIVGYTLPFIPIAIIQSGVCFLVAFAFGLTPTWNVLLSFVMLIPSALFYIGAGLLLGSLLNDRQVPGIASIVINVAALAGGVWFDLALVGGAVHDVCYLLPFVHTVDLAKAALAGDFAEMWVSLLWVVGYTIVVFALAVWCFRRNMYRD